MEGGGEGERVKKSMSEWYNCDKHSEICTRAYNFDAVANKKELSALPSTS